MTFLYIFLLSGVGVLVDILIKQAVIASNLSYLILGCSLYGLSGIGWYYVLKTISLTQLGILWTTCTLLLLTLSGYLFFDESLSFAEVLALVLLGIATTLLRRFL